TLEEAMSLPHADRSFFEKLVAYRRALLPDLASYASIDGAISSPEVVDVYAEREAEPERNRKLLESFRAVAKGQTAASRIAYLEARLLEEAGSLAESAEKFQLLAERGDRRPEPLLHALGCLRRAGRSREAEDQLRKTLDGPALFASEDLWRLWAMIG